MKRLVYLDMCRGFTVLFIPIIHCVMLYSKIEVHHTWFGNILGFIAEWPGGQLFMLMMGIWVAKSSKHYSDHFSRAALLFAAGYFLNILKYVLPAALGILPEAFIADTGFNEDRLLLELYMIGDILQFSAISLIIIATIKSLKGSLIIALVLLVAVICFSPMFWDLQSDLLVIQHLFDLIGGHPNRVFFPVFPWMVFVLAGFVLGLVWEESSRWMTTIFFIGVALFVKGYFIKDAPNAFGFYRTGAGGTCMHLGFVLMWVPFWRLITPFFEPSSNRISSLIKKIASLLAMTFTFCSKNITSIYFIQWIVVAWLFPVIGYRTLGVWQSLAIGIIVTAIVFTITYLFPYFFACPKK